MEAAIHHQKQPLLGSGVLNPDCSVPGHSVLGHHWSDWAVPV